MRDLWPILACSGAVLLPLSCHLVGGLGDLEYTDEASGGSTTTTATTSTSSGGSAGSGGGGGTGGTGTGGGGATGGAGFCLIPISDDFDDESIDTGRWSITDQQNIDVGENAAGRLFLAPWPNTTPAWGEVLSVATYDMTDCSVVVELPQVLANDGDLMTQFTISAGTWQDSAGFVVRNGMLASRVMSGGIETAISETNYQAGQHHWLRLREAGGTLYFETSTSAIVWSEQFQVTSPTYVTEAFVRFSGGAWSVASPAPGEAHYDNLNLLP